MGTVSCWSINICSNVTTRHLRYRYNQRLVPDLQYWWLKSVAEFISLLAEYKVNCMWLLLMRNFYCSMKFVFADVNFIERNSKLTAIGLMIFRSSFRLERGGWSTVVGGPRDNVHWVCVVLLVVFLFVLFLLVSHSLVFWVGYFLFFVLHDYEKPMASKVIDSTTRAPTFSSHCY